MEGAMLGDVRLAAEGTVFGRATSELTHPVISG